MTPALIAAEYLRREREAHTRTEGADCKAILAEVAEQFGVTVAEARAAVLDNTIMGRN